MESRTPCIYKFFNSLSGSTAVPEHKTAAGRHLELFMPRERLCISYSFDIYVNVHLYIRKTAARTIHGLKKRPFYAQHDGARLLCPATYTFLLRRDVYLIKAQRRAQARGEIHLYINIFLVILYCSL